MEEAENARETVTVDFRPRVVAFIDLLGYADLVRAGAIDDDLAEKTIGLLEKVLAGGFHESIDMSFPEEVEEYRLRVTARIFSDSLYLVLDCLDLTQDKIASYLFSLCLSLVYVQAELSLAGVFLRGGISVGKHYESPSVLFSLGLLEAYAIENSRAIYPRIVLADSIVGLMRKTIDDQDCEYADKLVKVDIDGEYFIDYLEYHAETEDHEVFFGCHKQIVDERLLEATKPRVREKYLWVARYHNWKVEQVFGDVSLGLRIAAVTQNMQAGVLLPKGFMLAAVDAQGDVKRLYSVKAAFYWEAVRKTEEKARSRGLVIKTDYAKSYESGGMPGDVLDEMVRIFHLESGDVEIVE